MNERPVLPLDPLTALSPLDGRYARHTAGLRECLSEFGLVRQRVVIEVRWLQHLAALPECVELAPLSTDENAFLEALLADFSVADANRIKTIEQTTNHDVKAVEYFLRERCAAHGTLARVIPFLHFACTSEDINNLAYALMLREARATALLPRLQDLDRALTALAHESADAAMLAQHARPVGDPNHHGQGNCQRGRAAAPPDRAARSESAARQVQRRRRQLQCAPFSLPALDWPAVSRAFVTSLGLEWNPYTTQIEPHDCIAEFCAVNQRINTVLIDFCRDVWGYISIGYFRQLRVANEVGSSTMPHKVNPIDFENAEGNCGVANALLEHFAAKLPISRWQRDLTDSTVLRNLGAALGYGVVALEACRRGIGKLALDRERLAADLDQAWEVLAEPIQTVMRRYGIADSYEALKGLTRGARIDQAGLHAFIATWRFPPRNVRGCRH